MINILIKLISHHLINFHFLILCKTATERSPDFQEQHCLKYSCILIMKIELNYI